MRNLIQTIAKTVRLGNRQDRRGLAVVDQILFGLLARPVYAACRATTDPTGRTATSAGTYCAVESPQHSGESAMHQLVLRWQRCLKPLRFGRAAGRRPGRPTNLS
jgi:hypothetical protein